MIAATRRSRLERWWHGRAAERAPWADALLAPGEAAYRLGLILRDAAFRAGWLRVHRLGVPVISVGNLAVGGSGKTPVVRWLVGELRRRGARPGVLHGGHAPDEPELHRLWYPDVPVIALRDRVEGGRRAVAAGADVLVLDDGFQHRRLARNLDLVLVPAEDWTDRHRLLPRGPLREPPAALARAHVVAVTRKTADEQRAHDVVARLDEYARSADVVAFRISPTRWLPASPAAAGTAPVGAVVAVAGIAGPERFVAHAAEAGAAIAATLAFGDHHRYGPADFELVRRTAAGRPVVTTAKDAVKLSPLHDLELWILDQTVRVEHGADILMRRLDSLLSC